MWPFNKRETKAQISQINQMGLPPVSWSERTARTYTTEGYERCVIVARCIQIVSRAVASIPICVEVGEKEVEEHPLIALMKRPNPMQGQDKFIEQVLTYYLVTGNTYIEALTAGNMPKELWSWAPYAMKVETPKKGMVPRGYTYDDGNPQHKRTWEIDPVTGLGEMIHLKTVNPLDPWYGLSPIAHAAFAADQHNEANTWNMRMLQNASVPSGAVMSKSDMTDGQYKRFKEEMESSYQGSKNARRPMVLSGDLSWIAMSLSPLEMDWLNGKNLSAREIAAAFGVPTQVIPIQGDQTFANYEQARLALWQDTVIPLANSFYADLSRWFGAMYGEDLQIELDLDEVPALEPARKAKWDMVSASTFLTTNEKREAVGMEPIKDTPMADRILMTGSQQPMPTAAEQEAADAQAEAIANGDAQMGPDGKPLPPKKEGPPKEEDLKTSVKRQLKAIGL